MTNEQAKDAELVLRVCLSIREKAPKKNDQRIAEAIQRVVDLYEAWHAAEPDQGYDAQADEWRAKLPKAQPDDRGDGNGIGDDE